MGLNDKEIEHIQYLMDKYPFEKRYKELLTQMQDVLEALGIMDKVKIDTDLLGQAVLNYFEDVDRLKEFEGIKRTNEDKIYGYATFWLLRDKPIQITDDDIPYEYLYINEKVFICMLISKMLKEAGMDSKTKNSRLLPFIKLLYYNFKFRNYTQQSIELMVSAFFCGCEFSTCVNNNACEEMINE